MHIRQLKTNPSVRTAVQKQKIGQIGQKQLDKTSRLTIDGKWKR